MTRQNHERRARELLLTRDEAERWVTLNVALDATGRCPVCGDHVETYETSRMRHLRLCAGSRAEERSW